MTYDPAAVAEVLVLMKELGYVNVKPDPNNPTSVLVSPAAKLTRLIEQRGITLRDFSRLPSTFT